MGITAHQELTTKVDTMAARPRGEGTDDREVRVVTSDTRTIVTETFVKAGPWALLSLMLVLAVGYEVHYFVTSYVDKTAEAISHIHTTQEQLTQLVDQNSKLIEQQIQVNTTNTQTLTDLMKHANNVMTPAISERKMQTELLQKILEELEEQHDNTKP